MMEAEPFIGKFGSALPANYTEPCFVMLEKFDDTVVLITGMGPIKARAGLEWFLKEHKIESVVNAGIAGALKNQYTIGEIIRVGEVMELASGMRHVSSHAFGTELKEVTLVTVEEPVFDLRLREELAADSDIVDMEGAVYASVCKRHHIPFTAIKSVSDMAGQNGRDTLIKNIDILSEQLADYLYQHIGVFSAKKT